MDNNQAYEMEQQQMQGSGLNQNKGVRKGSVDGQKKQEDQKSVFVQNVDYGTTVQELQYIFEDCGKIVRVTILKEKISFKPKGCAYIQFADFQGVYHALMLSGTKLRNRIIKVSPKRTNIRGMNTKGNMQKQLLFSKLLSTLAANRNK